MKLLTLFITTVIAQQTPQSNQQGPGTPNLPQIPGLSQFPSNPQPGLGLMDPSSRGGDLSKNPSSGLPPELNPQSPQQINFPGGGNQGQGPNSNFPLPPSLGQNGPGGLGGSNGLNGPNSQPPNPANGNGQGPKPSSTSKSATLSGVIQSTIKSQSPEASKTSNSVTNTSVDQILMIVLNLVFSIVYVFD